MNLFPDKLQLDCNNVKSLEEDPRIGSAGQPLRQLRRLDEPTPAVPRGPIDVFLT